MTLLELDEVHSYYGASHILRGVSLEVDEGEVVALLGRNGAGKTTTLRSIVGAQPPVVRDGSIVHRGTEIRGNAPEETVMGGIALVPEERRVFADLTVKENLHISDMSLENWNLVMRDCSVDHDTTMDNSEIYDLFPRLEERQEQKAGTLSGGEQQMLSIARTLKLPNTDLLLMDEPTEGLAPQIVQDVLESIESIAASGKTILLVEQNSNAALQVAEKCYVLDEGKIRYRGDADELEENDTIRNKYLSV